MPRRRRRSVAQVLAVFGDDPSLADIAAVTGMDRKATADAVDALIEAEVLYPERPPRFVHPIIQQALEDSIPHRPSGCSSILAAARELARDPARCEHVAAHLLAAGPVGERWAIDALAVRPDQVVLGQLV